MIDHYPCTSYLYE